MVRLRRRVDSHDYCLMTVRTVEGTVRGVGGSGVLDKLHKKLARN